MLSEKLRKQYMEALGYTYDKAGIKKMQSDYMARKSDVDGAYGNNTDILLRNLYNSPIQSSHKSNSSYGPFVHNFIVLTKEPLIDLTPLFFS